MLGASVLLSACETLDKWTVDLGFRQPETAKPTIPTPTAPLHFRDEDEVPGDVAPPSFVVSHAQVLLRDLGYPIGAIDGVKGPRTLAAIHAFQRAQGLSADGRVSATLLAQLQVARRELMVRETQARLARLGYEIGPIDGRSGPRTRAAISVFQEAEGLPVTGKVTPELVERLYSIFPPAQRKPALQAGPIAPPALRGSGASRIEAAEVALVAAQRLQLRETPAAQTAPNQTAEAAMADRETLAAFTTAGQPGVRGPGVRGADGRGPDVRGKDGEGLGGETPVVGTLDLAARPTPSRSRTSPHDERDGRPLNAGDRVRLSIGDAGSNVIEREVDGNGRIDLPGGVSVLAAGLTLDELKHAITIKLVESFVLDLNVDVTRPGLADDGLSGAPVAEGEGASGATAP